MPIALRRTLAAIAVVMIFGGAYLLDARQNVAYGYAWLADGSLLLLALREIDTGGAGTVGAPTSRLWWLLIFVLLLGGSGLSGYVAWSVYMPTKLGLSGPVQLGLWASGGLCCVLAGHLWDWWRRSEPFPRLFDRADWLWMLGLFVVAAAVRILNLGVEPPGLAPDEGWPLSLTLKLMQQMNRPAFSTDDMAISALYHYVVVFFLTHLGWLGLDTVQTAKLANTLFGAASVALLYATARLLANRAIAATAGTLLLWQGWHWILSRLYYSYAGDLLWISLTTALLVSGLESGRLSLMVAAGFAAAVGVSWLKTAVVLAPWAVLVCGEYLLARPLRRRRSWLLTAACLGSLIIFGLPLLAQFTEQSGLVWRFSDVAHQRARLLAQAGLTSMQGYYQGLLGAFAVLQVHEGMGGRHVVRMGRPALDLIASGLATVGFFWCVLRCVRDRGARLCVLGFLFFLIPAVTAFPVDGGPVASRRMAGSSLFVSWMAAYGAAAVAARLCTARRRFTAMLALAAASMAINVYYIHTIYYTRNYHWHEEMGVGRVYVIRALRQAATVGPVFFRPTRFTELASFGVIDLPNVTMVRTPGELREGLLKHPGELCSVMLPTDGATDQNDTPVWMGELADLISPALWEFGPPDIEGIPLYRLAHVRVAKNDPPNT